MTLGELKREIFSLNFEDFAEYSNYSEQVIHAINRAMSIITAELCPLVCYHEISQHPLESILSGNKKRGTDIGYDAKSELWFKSEGEAVSYYFECDGEGEAVLYDQSGQTLIPLVGGRRFSEYKGFCSGTASLKFKGDFAYTVKSIAFYKEKLSSQEEDIPPYSRYISYDMKTRTSGDFVGLEEIIVEGRNGWERLGSFKLIGYSTLLLPAELKGRIKVGYNRAIKRIDAKTPDSTELELLAEAAAILPLLCAYFVWIDDERSRSQEYYAQYEMRRDLLLKKQKKLKAAVLSPLNNKALRGWEVWQ